MSVPPEVVPIETLYPVAPEELTQVIVEPRGTKVELFDG